MERETQRDEFIRELVSQQLPDAAPEGFTEKVMDRLKPELTPAREHVLSPLTWGGIFVGIAAMIIVMFVVDVPFFSNFFSSTGIQQLSLDIFNGKFYDSFIRLFKSLNINAIGIAIVVGFISLVVLERILTRKRSESKLILL